MAYTHIPTFVAKGAFGSGTTTAAAAVPAGVRNNDLLLLFVNTANQTPTTPTGWSLVNSTGTGTAAAIGATSIYVYQKIATGLESTVTVATPSGNYTTAIMMAFRGVDPASPIHLSANRVDAAATTAMSWQALTTTVANTLIVMASGLDQDIAGTAQVGNVTAASLGAVTERHDQTVIAGNGGGIHVATGTKATAGATGTMTATGAASTTHAYVTIALKGRSDAEVIPRGQYQNDYETVVATGGTVTAQNDGIILVADMSPAWELDNSVTAKAEVETNATSFDGTATVTSAPYLFESSATTRNFRGNNVEYDSLNDRYISWGGYSGTTRYNEIWVRDCSEPGQAWRLQTTSGTPPTAANLAASAYYVSNGVGNFVIWGGNTGADSNQMMILNTTTWAWRTVTQTTPLSARSYLTGHMVAVPNGSNADLYLFGGWAATRENVLVKTTVSNTSTTCTWTTLKANGAVGNPTGRSGAIMAYKASTNKIYMYGGATDAATYLNDFWEYDITGNTWTNTSPTGTAPTGTELGAGGYDATNNRFWFTAGWTGTQATGRNNVGYINDVGGSESYVEVRAHSADNQQYAGHSSSGFCVDTKRGYLVMYGMMTKDSTERYSFAIDFNDGITTDKPVYGLNEADSMTARDAMAEVKNPDRNEWLQFNGFANMGDDTTIATGTHVNDIWAYDIDNNRWRYAAKGNLGMPHTEGSMASYDTLRDRVIVFGGLSGISETGNEVWEAKADANGMYEWKKLAPTGTKPTSRWLTQGTYDATNDRVIVVFGGKIGGPTNEVWKLDFSSNSDGVWTQITPTGAAVTAVTGAGFANDDINNRLYIFGGATNQALTTVSSQLAYMNFATATPSWVLPTNTGPTARRTPTMGYDDASGQAIVFGGFNGTASVNTLSYWNFSTGAWTNVTATSTWPDARRSATGSFFNNRFYITHGRTDTSPWYRNTWVLDPNYATTGASRWVNLFPRFFQPQYFVFDPNPAAGTQYHWQSWLTEETVDQTKVPGGWTTGTYYFNASDAAINDTAGSYTNDANAFDGSLTTGASTTTYGGTLRGEGTNAPTSGATITRVKARIYGKGSGDSVASWSSYTTLTAPTGGWTWQKVNDLEAWISCADGVNTVASTQQSASIYANGGVEYLGGTTRDGTGIGSGQTSTVYRVEVLVETDPEPDFILGSSGPPQFTKTHSTDAIRKRQNLTVLHTTSANREKSFAIAHTTSSYLKHGKTHTTDALKTLGTTILSPTYDVLSTYRIGSRTTSGSWSHTVANQTNRVLMVVMVIDYQDTISTLTYNGVALTLLTSGITNGAGTKVRTEYWYLMNPATGTNTIAYTMAGIGTLTNGGMAVSYYNTSGLDGTNFGTVDSGGNPNFNTTVSTAGSLTVVASGTTGGNYTTAGSWNERYDGSSVNSGAGRIMAWFDQAIPSAGTTNFSTNIGASNTSSSWASWLPVTTVNNREMRRQHTTDALKSISTPSFTRTHSTDSVKRKQTTATHTTDSLKRKQSTLTHTTSANKRAALTRTHTTNALLRKQFTKTHTTSANKKKANLTASHTTNALKRITSTLSHTTDTLKEWRVTKSHTTDAYLRLAFTKQHTTDALKRKATTVSHTTSANKRTVNTLSHTTSSNKRVTGITRTHTTDALKRKQNLLSHTTSANKKATFSRTHTTDAIKRFGGILRTHTTNALLRRQLALTHNTDTLKRKQSTLTHTTSSVKRKATTVSHTTSANKRKLSTLTHTTDALKRLRSTVSHTTDARIALPPYTTVNYYFNGSDGISQPDFNWFGGGAFDASTSTFSYTNMGGSNASGFIYGQGTNAPTSGNSITQVRVRGMGSANADGTAPAYSSWTTLTAPSGGWTWQKVSDLEVKFWIDWNNDSVKMEVYTDGLAETLLTAYQIYRSPGSPYLDVNIGEVEVTYSNITPQERSHTTDAYLRKQVTKTHTTDANKKKAATVSHTTSSNKRIANNLRSHTTDTLKRKQITVSHTTNANLRKAITTSHTTSANKRKLTTLTHTTNSVLRKQNILTHSTNANKRKATTVFHTTDANRRKATLVTHTTSANKRKATLVSHTTDSNKRKAGLVLTHTTNTLLRNRSALTHTTDANKRAATTRSHTTDAYRRRGPWVHSFADDTIGAQPAGWSKQWYTSAGSFLVDNSTFTSPANRVITETHTGANDVILTRDAVGAVQDSEIVAKVRSTNVSTYQLQLYLHVSGDTSNKNAWYMTLHNGFMIVEGWQGNVYFAPAGQGINYAWSANTWYWMRFRITGQNIQAKVWQDGQAEPGWQLSFNDARVGGAGLTGFGSYGAAGTHYFDNVAIAVDGATAPIIETYTPSHSTSANKRKANNTVTHTTDTVKRTVNTRSHTTDAFKRIRTTVSHTTNSFLRKQVAISHTTNALLRKQFTKQHSTDTLKRKANTLSHTTSTVIRKTNTLAHTTNALKRKAVTVFHTTNALKRKTNLLTHTTNALKRKQFTLAHTTSAVKRKVNTLSHTTSAFKRTRATLSHTTDSYLTTTYRYWVGGDGDWTDSAHWSYTSGGAGGASVPTVWADVVIENASSTGYFTIILPTTLEVNSINTTNLTDYGVFLQGDVTSGSIISVHSDLTFTGNVQSLDLGLRLLEGDGGTHYVLASVQWPWGVTVDSDSTTNWQLAGPLYAHYSGHEGALLWLKAGRLDLNYGQITAGNMLISSGFYLNENFATIDVYENFFELEAGATIVNPGTYHFYPGGISVTDPDMVVELHGGTLYAQDVTLGYVQGHNVTVNGGMAVANGLAFGNVTNTLEAGSVYQASQIYFNGYDADPDDVYAVLRSTIPGQQYQLIQTGGGEISGDYIDVQDSNVSGIIWHKPPHFIDSGNNTGWIQAYEASHSTDARLRVAAGPNFETLVDDFEDPTLDLTKWQEVAWNTMPETAPPSIEDGKAKIEFNVYSAPYDYWYGQALQSVTAYNLIGSYVSWEIPYMTWGSTPDTSQSRFLIQFLGQDLTNVVTLDFWPFLTTDNVRGAFNEANVTYHEQVATIDFATVKYFRASVVGDIFYFEGSVNGYSWTLLFSNQVYQYAEAAIIHIQGYDPYNTAHDGYMYVDNFNILPILQPEITHTTDALKRKATTVSHSTSSVLRKANTRTHTTSSVLRKQTTRTHTTNALLRKQFTKTHTTDANKRKATTVSHSTNALKRKTNLVTHTTNALKRKLNTLSHTTNTLLRKSTALTHTTNSFLRTRNARTHTTDANLKKATLRSHTTDSNKRKLTTVLHTTDANKRKAYLVSHTTSANKKKAANIVSHATNALKRTANVVSHTVDALKRTTNVLSHSTSSFLRSQNARTHTTDSLLRKAYTASHTTSANKKRAGNLVQHTTSANKRKLFTVAHSTSANKRKANNLLTHTTNALLRKQFTKSHTTDTLLRRVLTLTHSTNALLRTANTVSHSTNALKRKTTVVSHTTDTLKRTIKTVSHTTNSFLRRRITLTHSTDSNKRKALSVSHLADAFIRSGNQLNHNTDANKRKALTVSHTTSANKRKANNLVSHTTNAFKRTRNVVAHLTDANKRRVTAVAHTTDSLLRTRKVVQHTTDTLKRTANVLAHTTNALVRKANTVLHTTDANKRKALSVFHTTSANRRKATVATHTTNANKRKLSLVSHTTSANLKRSGNIVAHTTNALLRRAVTVAHSTSALLRKANTLLHTTNALKRKANTVAHTTSSNKRKLTLRTHTTNAFIRKGNQVTHSTSANLRKAFTVAHSTNALLAAANALFHTTSANKRKAAIVSHTTDTLKRKARELEHLTDALLRERLSIEHSTDSFLRKARTAAHSTSSVLRRVNTVLHTTNAVKRAANALQHHTDALLKQRYEATHDTDAFLRTQPTAQHSTDANKKRGTTAQHTTDANAFTANQIIHSTDARLLNPRGAKKVLVDGTWQVKQVKVLVDGVWVAKPVKYYDGTTWVTTTY